MADSWVASDWSEAVVAMTTDAVVALPTTTTREVSTEIMTEYLASDGLRWVTVETLVDNWPDGFDFRRIDFE